jgi:hypothetical protein
VNFKLRLAPPSGSGGLILFCCCRCESLGVNKELGCMTLKQGPNCGYWAQNGVIIGLYGPKTGSKLGLLAQNAVKVVKFIKIVCYWGGHNWVV